MTVKSASLVRRVSRVVDIPSRHAKKKAGLGSLIFGDSVVLRTTVVLYAQL